MNTSASPAVPPRRPARWFWTLKARLMIASALVIATSVAVSTLVVLERVEQRSEQAVMDLERDNAEHMASLLGQRVIGLQNMLRATAQALPAAARSDSAVAVDVLNHSPALTASFASVTLIAPDGSTLALHDGRAAGQSSLDLSGRDYFRQTLASGVPLVSAPFVGRVSMEPIIQLTMPVRDAEGRVAAVLAGALRLASRSLFDDLTYAGPEGESSVVSFVTDARGTIISHPDRSKVMHSIESEPALSAAVRRWVAQGRPVEPAGTARHDRGHFVAMAGVPGAGWMLFRVAADDELMGGLAQARREAVQWAAGVALLGGLLILGLVAVLLGPLSRLRRRALQLQDASLPIDDGWPRARGEIGELSRVLQQVLRERAQGEATRHQLAQQMSSVLASAPIGIGFTRARQFELASAEYCALLGRAEGGLDGVPASEIFASADDYEALGPEVRDAFAAGRPYIGELQFRRLDGSTFWGRLQGRPVDAADAGAGTIWLLEDVTERRAARERLAWSANHDGLTRLLNRAAFEERLQAWLAQPQIGVTASLLFLDLDRFKQINDRAGHAAGDRVLRDVAAVLHRHVRASDTAARLGGDEFALLLPGCVAAVAVHLGERLRDEIERVGVVHDGGRLLIGASVGVVEIEGATALPATEWMARADAACYEAKHAGRGRVRLACAASRAVGSA